MVRIQRRIPASNQVAFFGFKLVITFDMADVEDFTIHLSGPMSKTHLAPRALIRPSIDAPVPLTGEMHADLMAGTKILYFFGEIDYLDIFNEPHSTRFRFVLRQEQMTGPKPLLQVCTDGNEAA